MSHTHNKSNIKHHHHRPHEDEKCGGGGGGGNHEGHHGRGLRAFGGPLGLWFLRPRRNESEPPMQAMAEEPTTTKTTAPQHRPLPQTTTLAGGTKMKNVRRPQTSSIEWDDVRCRPVVRTGTGSTAAGASSTEDETSSSDDEEAESAWNTAEIATEENSEHQQSPHSCGFVAATPNAASKSVNATPWILRVVEKSEKGSSAPPRRHHRRTYSTKKRRNPWNFTPPMGYDPSKRGRVQGMSGDEATPALAMQDRDGASSAPTNSPSTICTRPTGAEDGPTAVSGDRDAPPKLNGELEQDGQGGTQTPVRQPTHSTSLSAARRFFQRLDEHHPLVLDRASGGEECSHPTTHRTIEGRSSRGRQRVVDPAIVHPVVSQEYRQHRTVCHDVGVPALPWRHFLRQRAWYHTGAYEGMLDDW